MKKMISIFVLLTALNLNASELIDPNNYLEKIDSVFGGMSFDEAFKAGEKVTREEKSCLYSSDGTECTTDITTVKVTDKNEDVALIEYFSQYEMGNDQISRSEFESVKGNFLRLMFSSDNLLEKLINTQLRLNEDNSFYLTSYTLKDVEYFGQQRLAVEIVLTPSAWPIPIKIELIAGVSFIAQLNVIKANFGVGSFKLHTIKYEKK